MVRTNIGLIGLVVMGQNLALNIESKGYPLIVYNRTSSKTKSYINSAAAYSIEELTANLKTPRVIILMVKAGKGSYKLQKPGVMVEGGEIILYAPHIKCFHSDEEINNEILSLGYHCRDRICHLLKSSDKVCKNAAAHAMNVTGPGEFNIKTDEERIYFKITLATGIPEEVCSSVGLGYRDPNNLKKKDFSGPGKLWIEEGGKYLYDLNINRKEVQ